MKPFILKMKRLQILSTFLIVCLLLLPAFNNAMASSKVYATKSVDFKVQAARHNSKPSSMYSSNPQKEEKKVYKQPSGPNPVGNYRPPSTRRIDDAVPLGNN